MIQSKDRIKNKNSDYIRWETEEQWHQEVEERASGEFYIGIHVIRSEYLFCYK